MSRPGHDPRENPLPWWLKFVLHVFTTRKERLSVISDLEELYREKLEKHGEASASVWLRRQSRHYVTRLPFDWIFGGHHERLAWLAHEVRRRSVTHRVALLLNDLRLGGRTLLRSPVFTLTVVGTVGLGIGGTTAVFSIVNTILISPLPYENSHELARIYTATGEYRRSFSVADYLALREEQTSFSTVAAFRTRTMTLNLDQGAERVATREITPGFFGLLGIQTALGRALTPDDGVVGSPRVTLVSHGFWRSQLGGEVSALGRTIRLNGVEYVVVGVLPEKVGPLNDGRDVFPTLQLETPTRKGPFFLTIVGRLRADVSESVAAAELHGINRSLFPIWQDSYQDRETTWRMMGLKEFIVGDVGPSLTAALGAVIFVLLIASSNTTNLLLSRTTQRRGELAVRSALGASRFDLARHLAAEAMLLAFSSTVVGLALSHAGMQLGTGVGGAYLPRSAEVGFTTSVWLFFGMIVVGSSMLFGMVPIFGAVRSNHGARIATGRSTPGGAATNIRRLLVASQFAVSVPLVVGTGLLLVSLARLHRVDLGFDTDHILTARVSLSSVAYRPWELRSFWDEATSQVAALPGVRSVGVSVARPPQEFPFSNNQNLVDKPTPPGETQVSVPWNFATPAYFDVLGIRLVDGRMFRETDSSSVVVDQAWADRFYPEGGVIGKRFTSGGCTTEGCTELEVVGVVGSVKYAGLENPNEGTVYMNFNTLPNWSAFVTLRTMRDPPSVLREIRDVVRRIDSSAPISDGATMEELVNDALQAPRYLTWVVTAFSGVALLLSVIGVYGVMAYFVQQHEKDIGIRLALGGRPATVRNLVVGRGMSLVVTGVAVGLVATIYVNRYLASLLYQVPTTDPLVISSGCALITILAAAACFFPALRASRTDPMRTLRPG